jgi:hypothetical protein
MRWEAVAIIHFHLILFAFIDFFDEQKENKIKQDPAAKWNNFAIVGNVPPPGRRQHLRSSIGRKCCYELVFKRIYYNDR